MTSYLHMVSKEEIPLVLSYLKNNLPISAYAYLHAKLVEGGFSGYGLITQGWPEFSGVMVIPEAFSDESADLDDHDHVATLFASETCDLQMFFKERKIWDLKYIIFKGLTENISDRIEQGIGHWSEGEFHCSLTKTTVGYWAKHIDVKPQLPSGYRQRRLNMGDIDRILGARPDHSIQKIKRILRFTKLTIGIENTDKELIGWAFKLVYGCIGMLFVDQAHRRLGIGRYIMATLGREIINEDGFCVTEVEPPNPIAEHMHESVGYHKISGVKFKTLFLKRT